MKIENITVFGGGSWGATLAAHLSLLGHHVRIWEFNPEIAKKLSSDRTLSTLPELRLPGAVQVSSNIAEALKDHTLILNATPSHTVRSTFGSEVAKKNLKPGTMVINASKGLDVETNKTMSQTIRDVFKDASDIVVLTGPSHAEEVAKGKPVVLVAASKSIEASKRVQELAASETFRLYTSEDPLGVELGGSLKNIYAVACGVVDGLDLGDNTKAALMSRGLLEMTRLGVKMGATPLTFFGLAGLGDLIVTCNSQHSRNRRLGEMIGKGLSLKEALAKMTMVAEGVNTTRVAQELSKKLKVEMPIVNEMAQVLFQNKSPRDSLKDLMLRQVGSEMEGIEL